MRLLKSKILVSILIIGFIAAPLSEVICQTSIEKYSGNNALNNFNVRNEIDDCDEPGISIFIINIHNEQKNFHKQALISPNLVPLIGEHLLEKKFISKFVEKISSSPTKISNKLYKLNSLFLI